jgi:hypothetical protein
MLDSNQARPKEVKVEDLLHLKRAERPDAAFWNQFDRELHQRMLQTLVKKDPWYIQVLRGLTGRIAQTTAVGAAAALLALFAIRPALVDESLPEGTHYTSDSRSIGETLETWQETWQERGVLPKLADFDLAAVMDYRIETISSKAADANYTAEYSLDSFEVASYGREAYVSDSASFALSGVATGLVY